MSWKSGIAAEVIGIPSQTIGENLYMAKIYLSTADLFAWTIVIILVSALFEKIFLRLLRAFFACLTPVSYTHLDVYKRQARIIARISPKVIA